MIDPKTGSTIGDGDLDCEPNGMIMSVSPDEEHAVSGRVYVKFSTAECSDEGVTLTAVHNDGIAYGESEDGELVAHAGGQTEVLGPLGRPVRRSASLETSPSTSMKAAESSRRTRSKSIKNGQGCEGS